MNRDQEQDKLGDHDAGQKEQDRKTEYECAQICEEPPRFLYYGTEVSQAFFIAEYGIGNPDNGFQGKDLLHIKLFEEPEKAIAVGKEKGKPVVFIVDTYAMKRDGYEISFYETGIWLSESINPKYFKFYNLSRNGS